MSLKPEHLARLITEQTALAFEASTGIDSDGQRWYLLRPAGLPARNAFGIRTTLGWRRLWVDFEPGTFAGELLSNMGHADETGRAAFRAVLQNCQEVGAEITFHVNGEPFSFLDEDVWRQRWSLLKLSLTKGRLELGTPEGEPDLDIICSWTRRFCAAVVAILPLEDVAPTYEQNLTGYPEGALSTVHVNRYERDRRNRAAAISIHGACCQACGMDFGIRYGDVAAGLIEVHHSTPVSELESAYVIDPARDLVPLCPNCHAVAHRCDPPLTVDHIKSMLGA